MTMAEEHRSEAARDSMRPGASQIAGPADLNAADPNATARVAPGAIQPSPAAGTVAAVMNAPVRATDHPLPAPAPASPVAKGAFELDRRDDKFNLKPSDNRSAPIPDDQRKISYEVYETRNVLKLLSEEKAFKIGDEIYCEFIDRLLQAAYVGCVSPYVDTTGLRQLLSKSARILSAEKVDTSSTTICCGSDFGRWPGSALR
jgi:hypothetical protein